MKNIRSIMIMFTLLSALLLTFAMPAFAGAIHPTFDTEGPPGVELLSDYFVAVASAVVVEMQTDVLSAVGVSDLDRVDGAATMDSPSFAQAIYTDAVAVGLAEPPRTILVLNRCCGFVTSG